MKKLLIFKMVVFVLILGAGCSGKNSGSVTTEGGDIVRRVYDDVNIAYKKETPINGVYMVYGLQAGDPDMLSDAYIAVIPIKTAKAILSDYPDMDKCDGAGSDKAKQAVQDIRIILPARAEVISKNLKEAENIYRKSRNRICLHLSGFGLQRIESRSKDKPLDVHDSADYIYLSGVKVVSCNQ